MTTSERGGGGFPRAGLCLAVAAAMLSACGQSTGEPPAPGSSQGTPPDLRSSRVMVLPVQLVSGVMGDPDAELAFGLTSRAEGVDWVFPPEVNDAVLRAPGLNARTTGLPVGTFLRAEVRRVGDPLYGDLRRLAALVNADVALLPVRAARATAEAGGPGRVTLSAALIHIRTGRVLWFGIVEGGPHPQGDPRGLASAVDALARTLLWYAGE